ncbi:MAG TPA: diguanylate cyclase [Terriglobales bacterium]|nr:diguanylate cyclase [Terriglobales bacterium]
MESIPIGILVVPSIAALLLFAVFSYLYFQTREPYFRAWQFAWAAYCGYWALVLWNFFVGRTLPTAWLARVLLAATALCILVSTRLLKSAYRASAWDSVLAVIAAIWAAASVWPGASWHLEIEVGVAALLVFCAYRFLRHARATGSLAFRVLALSLAFWAFLLLSAQFRNLLQDVFGRVGHFLDPLPQMLLGISMVMVLYENERRMVEENLLAFSTLEIDSTRPLELAEMSPRLERMLDRLMQLLKAERAALFVNERWRDTLPSVERGFTPEFLPALNAAGAGDALSSFVFRLQGLAVLRGLPEELAQLPPGQEELVLRLRGIFEHEHVRAMTAVSLHTRERHFGVLMFPHPAAQGFASSHLRLLGGLARQIGMTLENYALMHKAQRRTKEYELLTQVGQAVSSHLDPDQVLRTIHRELGHLFDTQNFYVAFLESGEMRFELEVEEGKVLPKRSRKAANGISEYVIRTGRPLLIRSDMESTRAKLGFVFGGRAAKCFMAVPILRVNQAVGIMAAMNYEREFAYENRDLEVMETAAGQVAVAMDNARLFAEEQRRARDLEFLNSVSKTAISSQNAEQMLAEIAGEIQKNFYFDHIGIGILDYATKEIEIKAEAGTTTTALGRRVPVGTGIIGKAARANELTLIQEVSEGRSILPDARSALAIPLTYAETLLGVLNVESRREKAFAEQEVLILRTLADLLATALHNAYVFQKLQQQAITDSLTGIKTRRFFLESVQAEWKRASRSGRPFSVVMVDLDRFKDINDTLGHLEGDLVLARIGRLLEQKSRQSNVVARYGGDEFVILMPETGVEQAQVLSERLRLWIATDPMLSEMKITGSFGVATYPLHGAEVEDVLRVADAGMYISKKEGGNRVSMAEEFVDSEHLLEQRELVTAYVDGFLRKESPGPEAADELVGTLKKLGSAAGQGGDRQGLMQALRTLTRAAETREYSAGHGDAVARFAEAIGHELMLPEDEMIDLVFAARVHDVGKIIIPERILNKPGPLSDDEFALMKKHVLVGAQIVDAIPGRERARLMVLHHHERFDGSGYPNGLRGEEIPLGSRIIAAAEAYVDMTTERAYAAVKTQEEAIAELEAMSGVQFDGMLVRILIRQLKGEKISKSGG